MAEMSVTLRSWMKQLLCCVPKPPRTPQVQPDVVVREEYANTFRTESYHHFWARVLELTNNNPATRRSMDSTSAARLPSYRLFAEYLLDPDQSTVTRLLAVTKIRPDNHALLTEYFSETADASLLCGTLLNDIKETRSSYKRVKLSLQSIQVAEDSACSQTSLSFSRISKFTKFFNPFVPSSSSLARFRDVQASCLRILHQLETGRGKAQQKLHVLKNVKCGSAICLVILTATITIIVVSHALAIGVALPGFMVASLNLGSSKRLTAALAQLDTAAKGTYILTRDFDTISRQVARLHDELEHIQSMVEFWVELGGKDQIQVSEEIASQLKKTDSSFREQLDELEEHLYLCFMTINRARDLVAKEISGARSASCSNTSP